MPDLWCVSALGVPAETTTLLAEACVARGVGFRCVQPGEPFEGWPADGDLLFRPAVSAAAARLERALWRPSLRTFWRRADWADTVPAFPPAVLARHGVPTPPTVGLHTADPARLRRLAASVGGPPWVIKVPGAAGGYGVFRITELAGLFSLAEFLLGEGHAPVLMPWVDGPHWRVVVVGERAVAAYRNPRERDDFRTVGGLDPADFCATVPERLAGPAVAAARALGVAHGGVDLLDAPTGPVVLECNFPCYFPHAQLHGGVDVAGAMLDHLLTARVEPERPSCAPPTGRRVLVVDGTVDPGPFIGTGVEVVDATDALPEPLAAGDALLQLGYATAGFRAASLLAGPGVRTLAHDPDVEPAILALLEAQPPWPPPADAPPWALIGPDGVVGPVGAEAEPLLQVDGRLRRVAWLPEAEAWRVQWIEGVRSASRAPAPGGLWPQGVSFAPATPPPAVTAAAEAWAARVGWRWIELQLITPEPEPERVHLHQIAVPPDPADLPEVQRSQLAQAVWATFFFDTV